MAEGNMLQIIVFAILFGLAMALSGDPGRRVLGLMQDLNEVILRLVTLVIELAPYGVFCLVANVMAEHGIDAIMQLFQYFAVVALVLLMHAVITYTLLLRLFTGLSPARFYSNMRAPLTLAFSTASSNATLPVTLETAEQSFGHR